MQSIAHVTRSPIATGTSVFGRPLQRISVEQYHVMIEAGVFSHGEKCELIRGVILEKPVPKPPHAYAVDGLTDLLKALAGPNRIIRAQQPITTADSEPEPDVALATGTRQDYKERHPNPDEVELVVEVADSSLREDRTTKLELYAEAGIECYWIVNLVARRIEVYTQPRGGKKPTYRKPTLYSPGESVPVVIGGKKLGTIPVSDILP
jgi:Uma2 family endonuclease